MSRSNSFQEYGRRERKEDEGSMEDAADKQYACLPAYPGVVLLAGWRGWLGALG